MFQYDNICIHTYTYMQTYTMNTYIALKVHPLPKAHRAVLLIVNVEWIKCSVTVCSMFVYDMLMSLFEKKSY